MSLKGFQRALADLVATPELCRAARADPAAAFGRYELTPLEERRLAAVVLQRGMATSCSLYRANRLTPHLLFLPLTCFLLGPRLRAELDRFWAAHARPGDLAEQELHGFAAQLRARLASGELEDPLLGPVLEYELAGFTLGLLPPPGADPPPSDGPARLHPRVRVVAFRHDPAALLPLLNARQAPPYALEEGEFYLMLDARGPERAASTVAPRLGRLLRALDGGGDAAPAGEELEALLAAGLAIPGRPG
ncbi:MAG: hypothetical protein ABW277_00485 [Longimicrobiaceae bacterium]